MERKHEEAQATVLWAFIQQLRERDIELVKGLDGLTPEVATELAGLLQTARDVSVALQLDPSPAGSAAERVSAAIAARSVVPLRRRRTMREWLLQLEWGRRLAFAGALAVAVLIGGVVGRGAPGSDPLARPANGIAALTHEAVRREMPLLAKGELAPAEARAVFWHLAHCNECFRRYEGMMSQTLPHYSPSGARVFLANSVTVPGTSGRTERSLLPQRISERVHGSMKKRLLPLGLAALALIAAAGVLRVAAQDDGMKMPSTPKEAMKLQKSIKSYKQKLVKDGKYLCCVKPTCDFCASHMGGCSCGRMAAMDKPVCRECKGGWEAGEGAIHGKRPTDITAMPSMM